MLELGLGHLRAARVVREPALLSLFPLALRREESDTRQFPDERRGHLSLVVLCLGCRRGHLEALVHLELVLVILVASIIDVDRLALRGGRQFSSSVAAVYRRRWAPVHSAVPVTALGHGHERELAAALEQRRCAKTQAACLGGEHRRRPGHPQGRRRSWSKLAWRRRLAGGGRRSVCHRFPLHCRLGITEAECHDALLILGILISVLRRTLVQIGGWHGRRGRGPRERRHWLYHRCLVRPHKVVPRRRRRLVCRQLVVCRLLWLRVGGVLNRGGSRLLWLAGKLCRLSLFPGSWRAGRWADWQAFDRCNFTGLHPRTGVNWNGSRDLVSTVVELQPVLGNLHLVALREHHAGLWLDMHAIVQHTIRAVHPEDGLRGVSSRNAQIRTTYTPRLLKHELAVPAAHFLQQEPNIAVWIPAFVSFWPCCRKHAPSKHNARLANGVGVLHLAGVAHQLQRAIDTTSHWITRNVCCRRLRQRRYHSCHCVGRRSR